MIKWILFKLILGLICNKSNPGHFKGGNGGTISFIFISKDNKFI